LATEKFRNGVSATGRRTTPRRWPAVFAFVSPRFAHRFSRSDRHRRFRFAGAAL